MRIWVGFLFCTVLFFLPGCDNRKDYVATNEGGTTAPASGLPLPSTLTNREFEELLYPFLNARRYVTLGWSKDKGIRDTGPYRNGVYYGTHPAVRVYYSPEMIAWLETDRSTPLPDGAMVIKEMYPPPAARYQGAEDSTVPTQWTVMVRDKAGAHDGWYWSYYSSNPGGTTPPTPQPPDNNDPPFDYPNSGFGQYCVRCHGSAESSLTFVSTENIEGFAGTPKTYEVDNSWISDTDPGPVPHPNDDDSRQGTITLEQALNEGVINEEFLAYFQQFPVQQQNQVAHLPGVTTDHVVAKAHRRFSTSDQCMSCHSGDTTAIAGPNMVKNDTDISPWGEWSWSMMGLAGRDPIFYAQLETEMALHDVAGGDFNSATIANFCLRCHGVMGQRQHQADKGTDPFTLDQALASDETDPNHIYGGLARDGVSCTVCHQISDQASVPVEEIETGKFILEPAVEGIAQIFGPHENLTERPMLESLGYRPRHGAHIKDSKLCASCHTVNLPVLNTAGKTIDTRYEQSTYFEWQNSDFAAPGVKFQSCQDCHMPNTFHDNDPLEFKVANVQDQDFPEAHGTAPVEEITVNKRSEFVRHELAGVNVFALEMFRQFPDILGIRPASFMTGYKNGLDNSIKNSLEVASKSAQVEILDSTVNGSKVETRVKVTNLTGHRLPSGVGFRRLILEVLIKDSTGAVVWGSGRTNSLGLIVDATGTPLPSETHQTDPGTGAQTFEPHYQLVDAENKAQVYGELNRDTTGKFTTSFLARASDVKDNRLMPLGWRDSNVPGMTEAAVEATNPVGEAEHDPDFTDGTGSDIVSYAALLPPGAVGPFTVETTLSYQSIPPGYLKQRFEQASGPATKRLHYMSSRLDLSGTPYQDWKLPLARAAAAVTP